MLRIKRCIWSCVMLSHSSCSPMASCWLLIDGWRQLYTRFPSWSQRCSIRFKSSENAGQGRTCTPFWLKKSMVSLAEWACALSCWKRVTSPLLRKNRTFSGSKISSMYRRAVKLPSTTMSWVLWCHEIPPHTIMLPPPQRDTCLTQQSWNRSPRQRHTLRRLSNISTQKWDLSVNSTPRQRCCVHQICCRHQLKRLIWRSAVKMFPYTPYD